jgi:hypothetical protein
VKKIIYIPCVEAPENSAECVPFYPYIASLGYFHTELAILEDDEPPMTWSETGDIERTLNLK